MLATVINETEATQEPGAGGGGGEASQHEKQQELIGQVVGGRLVAAHFLRRAARSKSDCGPCLLGSEGNWSHLVSPILPASLARPRGIPGEESHIHSLFFWNSELFPGPVELSRSCPSQSGTDRNLQLGP